jgi:hypothetical protein
MQEPGIYQDVNEAEYHRLPSLSQSALKTLLDCPARFAYERENPREVGAAADLGSVVHGLLLGGGTEIVVIDAPNYLTNLAKQARDEAKAAGHIPLLASAYAEAHEMAEAVLANLEARELLEAEGDTELSMRWDKEHGAARIPMRGRIDKASMMPIGPTLVDVKTARSASPELFATQVLNYGYHIQQAVYMDGWEELTGDRPDFAFIVVENTRPFLTTVYRLDDVLSRYGVTEYYRALGIYVECSRAGEWPAYPGGTLAAPGWLRHREQRNDGEGYDTAVWDEA